MPDIFKEIRDRVSMPDVARFYGLQISRSGMTCCPFHEERTPSMKIYDNHFYCFGCGATGDCTGFVARLFGVSQFEAAKTISHDFGLNLTNGEIAAPVNKALQTENEYRIWLKNANAAVSEYLKKLTDWRKMYSPQKYEDKFHPLFLESLMKTDYIKYLSGLLAYGSENDKRELYQNNKNEIREIQKRVADISSNVKAVRRKAI